MYFGNPAGYISRNIAVVAPIFKGEALEKYLERQGGIEQITWKTSVYDRLVNGQSELYDATPLKNLRIWQLKPKVNIYMKFSTYKILLERFREPEPQNYQKVYDGEIETNDLEQICEKFDLEHDVPGYHGHLLSVSDVIKLYDESGSEYYYVNSVGFEPIEFGKERSEQMSGMQL